MRLKIVGAIALAFAFVCTACGGGGGGGGGATAGPPMPLYTAGPAASAIPTLAATASPAPSATPTKAATATPAPQPTATPLAPMAGTYSALGDSITYGAGASSIFAPTSVTTASTTGTNFPTLVARAFGMRVQNLGISGARIASLVNVELPEVSPLATEVTIYVGTNDMWDAANTTNVAAAVASFATSYRSLVASVKLKAPAAKIILINLPDLSRLPFFASPDASWSARLHDASAREDAFVATLGLPVIDLANDPFVYDPQNLEPAGLHPNDLGYAHIAGLVEAAMQAQHS